MSDKNKININLNAKIITQLLRMIAPVFPPQHHVYGAIGALDINSKNVLLMFYFLVTTNDVDAIDEIKMLRKARVMKIYSAVINNLLELREGQKYNESSPVLSFEDYIEKLISEKCLHSRSNKFDLR